MQARNQKALTGTICFCECWNSLIPWYILFTLAFISSMVNGHNKAKDTYATIQSTQDSPLVQKSSDINGEIRSLTQFWVTIHPQRGSFRVSLDLIYPHPVLKLFISSV